MTEMVDKERQGVFRFRRAFPTEVEKVQPQLCFVRHALTRDDVGLRAANDKMQAIIDDTPRSPARPPSTELRNRLGFCEFLRHSPVQRVLSRGVYEEQYEQSLRDCMAGSEGFAEMLEAHRFQVRRTPWPEAGGRAHRVAISPIHIIAARPTRAN